MKRLLIGGSLLGMVLAAAVSSAQHPAMPPGMSHEEHLAQMQKEAEMKKRGAAAMGFDQDATTHHFGLTATGAFIQVQVHDPADVANRDAIRGHLKQIAAEFASGDFSKPFMTHAENPPGVETMRRLKALIGFTFEQTESGGRVRIWTADAEAVQGVHAFVRYQIAEHRTGDSLTVQK
jgi:hypothetical protein